MATGADAFSESDIQGWQSERERAWAIAKSIVERRATGPPGGEQEKVEKGASALAAAAAASNIWHIMPHAVTHFRTHRDTFPPHTRLTLQRLDVFTHGVISDCA